MAKILVLYYSMYGHIETMVNAVAEGSRRIEGSRIIIKLVPDRMQEGVARKAGAKLDQATPLATVEKLPEYAAIIFGTPARFGNMCTQMRNFLDRTGRLWLNGCLIGKVGSLFTSTATRHGGHETTITSFHTTLLHHGMFIVGVSHSCQEIRNISEITDGLPYAANTLAGGIDTRQPSENELKIARFQEARVAEVAKKQSAYRALE
jgi:NAD(P)H dehydrogenase (quinone)